MEEINVQVQDGMIVLTQHREKCIGKVEMDGRCVELLLKLIGESLAGQPIENREAKNESQEDVQIQINGDEVRLSEHPGAPIEKVIGGSRQMFRDALKKGLSAAS